MKIERIQLQRVEFMPKQLEPGILYLSEKYNAVAHLCACGCGAKIRTPLGPTEWAIEDTTAGPSLWPSVGNWQQVCKSHYVIDSGNVVWCGTWTPERILAGRRAEEARRKMHYDATSAKDGLLTRFWNWFKGLLGK
jgi:hypothetical protein